MYSYDVSKLHQCKSLKYMWCNRLILFFICLVTSNIISKGRKKDALNATSK